MIDFKSHVRKTGPEIWENVSPKQIWMKLDYAMVDLMSLEAVTFNGDDIVIWTKHNESLTIRGTTLDEFWDHASKYLVEPHQPEDAGE